MIDNELIKDILNNTPMSASAPLVEFTSKIIVALITIVLTALCVKITRFLIRRVFIDPSKKFLGSDRKINTMSFIINWSVKYVIYFFALGIILQEFGVPVQSILAMAGIGSVAIGFGAQSLVRDVITGLFILLEDQLAPGDTVSIGNITGEVETLGLRTTRIRSIDGFLHIIPNGVISIVTNMSRDYKRVTLNINILYEKNMDNIVKVLNGTLKNFAKNTNALLSEPKILGVSEVGENNITITVTADCKVGEDSLEVERDMRKFIKENLDESGITIRTV